jgi:hypothetical protein
VLNLLPRTRKALSARIEAEKPIWFQRQWRAKIEPVGDKGNRMALRTRISFAVRRLPLGRVRSVELPPLL